MNFETAVITGVSGGLGTSFAKILKQMKVKVIGTDIKNPNTPQLFDAFIAADVRDLENLRQIAQDFKPNLWINNAGLLANGLFYEIDINTIKQAIEVNLLGVINGTKAAYEVMIKNKGGHILNVGSLASFSPTPGMAIYSATKHAVRAYTHSVAAEINPSSVKLTLLAPDGILTPMLKDALSKPDAFMPFTGSKLLDPDFVAKIALIATQKGKLTVSIPRWRSFLARLGGEVPALALWLSPYMKKIGSKNQAKLQNSLKA